MIFNMTTDELWQSIQTFGTLLIGLYLIYKHITSGEAEITKVTMTAYKERNKQLDFDMKDLAKKFEDQGKEIAKLMGKLEEKEKQIKEFQATIENRNPALEKTLSDISEYMKESTRQMQSMTEILLGMDTRNKEIDRGHTKALAR